MTQHKTKKKKAVVDVADLKSSSVTSAVFAAILSIMAGEVLPALRGPLDPLLAPLLCEHTWERSGRLASCSGVDMSTQILAFEFVAWWLVIFTSALLLIGTKNALAQRADATSRSRWGRLAAIARASFFAGPMVAIVVGVFFPTLLAVSGPVICDEALAVGSSAHSYKPGQSGIYHSVQCGTDDVTFQALAVTCLAFYVGAFMIFGIISLVRTRISGSSANVAAS